MEINWRKKSVCKEFKIIIIDGINVENEKIQSLLSCEIDNMDGLEISSITKGLCLLVGLHKTDEKKDIDDMVQKILKLRLFNQGEKIWHSNVTEMNYEILSISQFTLCYKLKGNKLDFHNAMPGNLALENYQYFLDALGKNYNENKIKDGAFGKKMEVELVNDGPVTVQLEYPNPEKSKKIDKKIANRNYLNVILLGETTTRGPYLKTKTRDDNFFHNVVMYLSSQNLNTYNRDGISIIGKKKKTKSSASLAFYGDHINNIYYRSLSSLLQPVTDQDNLFESAI